MRGEEDCSAWREPQHLLPRNLPGSANDQWEDKQLIGCSSPRATRCWPRGYPGLTLSPPRCSRVPVLRPFKCLRQLCGFFFFLFFFGGGWGRRRSKSLSEDNCWLFSVDERLGDLVPAQKRPHQGWFQLQRAVRETWQAWSQTTNVTLSFLTEAKTLQFSSIEQSLNNQRKHVAIGIGRF